ncbi:hypothetical protein QJS10_CPA05g01626 [Acorus calamus]|uniref:Reverse transcriptase zinc-binding domain-containing protein n=1 Tax=Acorus calamus TaxID=4465 RepID=A0AAV9EQS2_ACOCL|nr:hypothetical protein QJS10_CPA05g01626 [Acorus calamus]
MAGQALARTVGCTVRGFPVRVLGFPLCRGRLKKEDWDPLVERFQRRLAGWKGKLLSYGGRLTLLQAVLSALPLFFLLVFRISVGVLDRIETLRRRFLWQGTQEGTAKPHLVKWSTVCLRKEDGGLGVLDLRDMNRALLSKWLWRWLHETDNPWARTFQDRYGGHGTNARIWPTVGARASSLCKGIFSDSAEFEQAVRWEIGMGEVTRFWTDVWCGDQPLCAQFLLVYALVRDPLETVRNCWTVEGSGGRWSAALRRNIFAPEEASQLQALADRLREWEGQFGVGADRPRWAPKPNAGFTVRNSYIWWRDLGPVTLACGNPEKIWSQKIPRKIKVFLWLLAQERLLTRTYRSKWRGGDDVQCGICGAAPETAIHLFGECRWAQAL